LSSNHPRILREHKTIDLMIRIYCQGQHRSEGAVCQSCQTLRDYAHLRLEKCPYQEKKTTCANCPTHCYKKSMREQVKIMMRYAGPRMMLQHPWYAILHLIDGFRKPVELPHKIKTQENE
jgi:hypothetical protein